jgi:membrane protein implicated in regulation of membrane protease activity
MPAIHYIYAAAIILALLFAAAVLITVLSENKFKKTLFSHPSDANERGVIGEVATVTERVCNAQSKGLVKVRGRVWSAYSADGEDLEAGEKVCVISVKGSRLVCRRF